MAPKRDPDQIFLKDDGKSGLHTFKSASKSLNEHMPLFAWYMIACLIFSACSASGPDERDQVAGRYTGIKVFTQWGGGTPGWNQDTLPVKLYVLKARRDSVLSLYLDSIVPGEEFAFLYINQICSPINNPRNPKLVFDSDSLYFYYKGGLGPAWIECFGIKD
jgi:hypothetical protein